MPRFNKLIAIIIALLIYIIQKRLGMSIIAFLLANLLLEENLTVDAKTIMRVIVSVALFFIGHKLSLWLSLRYVAPIGNFAWTFTGGFIGGVVELETYLLFVLFPMKLILCKNLMFSTKYVLKAAIVCFLIGGIIQGTYMAGWQNLFYI